MNTRKIGEMFEDHREVRHIFPDEEVLVLADRIIDETVPKFCFARTPVLVDHPAPRRQKTFPTALPGLIRHIGIFDVKWMVERIKSTDRQEFVSVYSARAATGPKHRNDFEILVLSAN